MRQGEIYMADLGYAAPHPVIVVSKVELNRGDRVLAVLVTSQRFAFRSQLAHCVPFNRGEFGFTLDCVAQCENLLQIEKRSIMGQPLAKLDAAKFREIVLAIGNVIDSYCEPN
jgi:mRNA-degrading endonuclease toxin of MazEF toxin-antitoxin module